MGPVPRSAPLPAWYGRAWMAVPVHVVEDTAEHLVTYTATGAELGFVDHAWPTASGRHPWHGRGHWHGNGTLMVQRPGDHHAVWHFWTGEERTFACWYVNLQAAAARTAIGYDTQDFELDLVVFPDGTWVVKDLELMEARVAEGRFTGELVRWVLDLGEALVADLASGHRWWDPAWAEWEPPAAWRDTRLPVGWSDHPSAVALG
jgi:Protein of unknown function (DUF402)